MSIFKKILIGVLVAGFLAGSWVLAKKPIFPEDEPPFEDMPSKGYEYNPPPVVDYWPFGGRADEVIGWNQYTIHYAPVYLYGGLQAPALIFKGDTSYLMFDSLYGYDRMMRVKIYGHTWQYEAWNPVDSAWTDTVAIIGAQGLIIDTVTGYVQGWTDSAKYAILADSANYWLRIDTDTVRYADTAQKAYYWLRKDTDTVLYADTAQKAYYWLRIDTDTVEYANYWVRKDIDTVKHAIYAETTHVSVTTQQDSMAWADTAGFAWFADSARHAAGDTFYVHTIVSDTVHIKTTIWMIESDTIVFVDTTYIEPAPLGLLDTLKIAGWLAIYGSDWTLPSDGGGWLWSGNAAIDNIYANWIRNWEYTENETLEIISPIVDMRTQGDCGSNKGKLLVDSIFADYIEGVEIAGADTTQFAWYADTSDWNNLKNIPSGFADNVDDVNDADYIVGNETDTFYVSYVSSTKDLPSEWISCGDTIKTLGGDTLYTKIIETVRRMRVEGVTYVPGFQARADNSGSIIAIGAIPEKNWLAAIKINEQYLYFYDMDSLAAGKIYKPDSSVLRYTATFYSGTRPQADIEKSSDRLYVSYREGTPKLVIEGWFIDSLGVSDSSQWKWETTNNGYCYPIALNEADSMIYMFLDYGIKECIAKIPFDLSTHTDVTGDIGSKEMDLEYYEGYVYFFAYNGDFYRVDVDPTSPDYGQLTLLWTAGNHLRYAPFEIRDDFVYAVTCDESFKQMYCYTITGDSINAFDITDDPNSATFNHFDFEDYETSNNLWALETGSDLMRGYYIILADMQTPLWKGWTVTPLMIKSDDMLGDIYCQKIYLADGTVLGTGAEEKTSIYVDSIYEHTSGEGVWVDGVVIKDGNVDGRDVSADGAKLDNLYETITGTDTFGSSATADTVVNTDIASTSLILSVIFTVNPEAYYWAEIKEDTLIVSRSATTAGAASYNYLIKK